MAEVKRILVICGEPSGDLNAANLILSLKDINPDIKISGVGGAFMQQTDAQIYCDIKDLAVIGLFDVFKKLPKFFSLLKLILKKIKEEKPDGLILVDFSGFNLRLAKKINKAIPTIYYISPQVWASRPGRIKTIKKYIHKMVVLFRFEQEFYKRYGIDADFVGHPLLDIVKPEMTRIDFLRTFKISDSKTTIALLPGSRKSEIKNILPVMIEAAIRINKKIKNLQFVIAKIPGVDWDIYKRIICAPDIDLQIVEGRTYACLSIADFCLVASGTAALETAIMQKPFVVIYKMNLLNYLFYRPQVKVPHISLVNILAGKEIVPEFIQFKATAKRIAKEVIKILKNPSRLSEMKNDLAQIKTLLGEPGAASRAARIIIDFLSQD